MTQYRFTGLRHGDTWCVCAPRWHEAFQAGAAQVELAATRILTLEWGHLDDPKAHAAA